MKTGSRHLAALKDGRHWILDGAAVDDVTTHAAFRNFPLPRQALSMPWARRRIANA